MEIESLLHLELPTSCYGNTTSAPQLCSSGHWIWHLSSYCWFCISPPVLLCSRRIVSHFSCRGNIYSESRLQREEGLNLCVLGSRGSRCRLACGAINSSNLWIDVLHVLVSKPQRATLQISFISICFSRGTHYLLKLHKQFKTHKFHPPLPCFRI